MTGTGIDLYLVGQEAPDQACEVFRKARPVVVIKTFSANRDATGTGEELLELDALCPSGCIVAGSKPIDLTSSGVGYINLQADANRPVACVLPCVRFNHVVSPSFGFQGYLRLLVVHAVSSATVYWVS